MSKQILNIVPYSSLLFQPMRICVKLRHVFKFETKFGLCELLHMVTKLHTYITDIYRAVAFSPVLKNSFEVRRST